MENANYKKSPCFLLIIFLIISSQITSCIHKRLDDTEKVVDKFLRASVANDLADLQETLSPECLDTADMILFQFGLSALVGGAEFEYVELEVQTVDKDDSRATVHAEGKLQGKILGTQLIVPINSDIPLEKKDGRWYVACDYSDMNEVAIQDASEQSMVSQYPGEQIIDNWKLLVLETKELESFGSDEEPSEGYKLFGIHLSVENLSNEMAELWIGGLGTFFCEDDRGFTYDVLYLTSREGPSEFPIYALNPPNYRVNGWLACEVPTSASIKYLVINSGNSEVRFDLENIEPIDLNFPTDNPTLMSVGEPLTQEGVLTITPLSVLLFQDDNHEHKTWKLFVEVLIENLYGYEYGIREIEIQIYDSYGQTGDFFFSDGLYYWPDSILENHGYIREILPGSSNTGFIGAIMSEYTTELPEQPTGFKMLIYMPSPNGPIDSTSVYGLYDLGDFSIIRE